jgi:hypothetical protein
MNVRKKINAELRSFLVEVAEAYGAIIEPVVKSISANVYESAIDRVTTARDTAEDALVEITAEAVHEAFLLLPEETNFEEVINKLLPKDMLASPEVEYREYHGQVSLPPPKVFEGPLTDPPRKVEDATPSMIPGQGLGGMAADPFYDPREDIAPSGPIVTLEEEKRRELGIASPPKIIVHFDGKTRVEQHVREMEQSILADAPVLSAPPGKTTLPPNSSRLTWCLEELRDLMVPYIQAKHKDLSVLACSALVLINTALLLTAALEAKVEALPEPVAEEGVSDAPK